MFREKQLANYTFSAFFLEYFFVCWICYVLHIVIATKTFFLNLILLTKMLTTVSGFFLRRLLGRAMMILLSKSIKIESKL